MQFIPRVKCVLTLKADNFSRFHDTLANKKPHTQRLMIDADISTLFAGV